jgi:hypothetical protein
MNIDVAERAIGWIEANPEKHNQKMWATETECGTTMCLAGVIAHQAGGRMIFEGVDITAKCVTAEGIETDIPTYASELLGLEPDGLLANQLFYANNTLEDIKNLVKDAANGEWNGQT